MKHVICRIKWRFARKQEQQPKRKETYTWQVTFVEKWLKKMRLSKGGKPTHKKDKTWCHQATTYRVGLLTLEKRGEKRWAASQSSGKISKTLWNYEKHSLISNTHHFRVCARELHARPLYVAWNYVEQRQFFLYFAESVCTNKEKNKKLWRQST